MVLYEFRYFRAGASEPVVETVAFEDDRQAVSRAASEMLQMRARIGVEVWSGRRLVYERRRGPRRRG